LKNKKARNAELQEKLDEGGELQSAGSNERDVHDMIPRPKGTAGTNFSIQEEMGLAGSTKKYDKYKAIQVHNRKVSIINYSLLS